MYIYIYIYIFEKKLIFLNGFRFSGLSYPGFRVEVRPRAQKELLELGHRWLPLLGSKVERGPPKLLCVSMCVCELVCVCK